jgi:hypothetical protein
MLQGGGSVSREQEEVVAQKTGVMQQPAGKQEAGFSGQCAVEHQEDES